MQRYEYKVVPAPQKGTKAKGVKTPEGRFANSIEQLLNTMGQDGWQYQRAELLPSEERSGLTGSAVNWRNVLVFRRAIAPDAAAPVVEPVAAPVVAEEQPAEPDGTPLARPVPGPDDTSAEPNIEAPAPIAAAVDDPPLTLKSPAETQDTDEAETPSKT